MRKRKYKTQIIAVKEANTGKELSKQHKLRIKNGLSSHDSSKQVKACNPKTDQHMTFNTAAECARFLKCSRQLISQCIKRPEVFKSARGWTITLVSKTGSED